jgi:hypothetical protein
LRFSIRDDDKISYTILRRYFSFFSTCRQAGALKPGIANYLKLLATQKKWKTTRKMVEVILSSFLKHNDMHYILFDDASRDHLLPFTHTRPVADIRCGILTMRSRWELCLQQSTSSLTQDYLSEVFPATAGNDNIYINGGIFATHALAEAINKLEDGQKLVHGNTVIAARIDGGGM